MTRVSRLAPFLPLSLLDATFRQKPPSTATPTVGRKDRARVYRCSIISTRPRATTITATEHAPSAVFSTASSTRCR